MFGAVEPLAVAVLGGLSGGAVGGAGGGEGAAPWTLEAPSPMHGADISGIMLERTPSKVSRAVCSQRSEYKMTKKLEK